MNVFIEFFFLNCARSSTGIEHLTTNQKVGSSTLSGHAKTFIHTPVDINFTFITIYCVLHIILRGNKIMTVNTSLNVLPIQRQNKNFENSEKKTL